MMKVSKAEKANKAILVRKLQKVRDELWAIEEKEAEERGKKLIGKCFKYRNSYGTSIPGTWWLYMRVDKVKGMYAMTFQFQTDCRGDIRIERKETKPTSGLFEGEGYGKITKAEFNREWKKLQHRIARIE